MPFETPMIRQYQEAKKKYQDAFLFFRLGDFYEMFFEDAEKASKILDLTLTSRNKNQEDSVPLCGIPVCSSQGYIQKLLSLGHKVAICEQVEDPALAKGIVKREVVSVLTPGIVLDPGCLEGGSHHFLVSLSLAKARFGRAKARLKKRVRNFMHRNLEEQAEAINRFLAGHFNYGSSCFRVGDLRANWTAPSYLKRGQILGPRNDNKFFDPFNHFLIRLFKLRQFVI